MHNNYRWIKPRFFLVWIGIAAVIGLTMAFLLSAGLKKNLSFNLIFSSLISSILISTSSAFSGYWAGYATKKLCTTVSILLTAIISLIGMAAGFLSAVIVNTVLLPNGFIQILKPSLAPIIGATALITLAISMVSYRLEYLKISHQELSDEIANKHAPQKLSFMIKSERFVISPDEVIYISSHGKKTVIHCTSRDYEINALLASFEEKLHGSAIIRIHKCFMINTEFLSTLSYHKGGRYCAILKDEDESILPVGRSYLPLLRKLFL